MKLVHLTVNLRASCETCLNLSSFDTGRTKLPISVCRALANAVLSVDDFCVTGQ